MPDWLGKRLQTGAQRRFSVLVSAVASEVSTGAHATHLVFDRAAQRRVDAPQPCGPGLNHRRCLPFVSVMVRLRFVSHRRLLAFVTATCVPGALVGCADPVTTGVEAPSNSSEDVIAVPVPGKRPQPTPTKTVPLEVIKQNPIYDASYPDAQFVYEPPAPKEACARSEFLAEPLPVDLYLMLDRSGSMNIPESLPPATNGDCDVGDPKVSRWCYTLNALDGFFGTGDVERTGVALQFFPNGTCSETPPIGHDCCESGACCGGGPDSVPAVPLGLLSENRQALVDALNAQSPAGVTTPIEAALRGMTAWTKAQKTPLRSMAGLLITDGEPSGCSNNSELLAAIVAQHLSDTGIPTFVLGMDGAKFAPLEAIAAAGGGASHTDYCPSGIRPCHVYNVGNGDPTAFSLALEQIKGAVVQCRFAMPSTDSGVVDPRRMQVVYRQDAGDQVLTFVASPEACAELGYYFDDNEAPTEVALCPETCAALRSARASEVILSVDCLGL